MKNGSSTNPEYEKKNNALKTSDSESGRSRKRQRPFCDNLREYLKNTSLHGFRYILDERSTRLERWWWVCMVITSMTVCSFFIWKVWDQWDKTPVIVSFADTSNSAWTIPFPAVTVCTETKPRQRIFNFTKAHEERRNSTISPEDLKTYHDMLLLCNNPNGDGPAYADGSTFDTLRKLAPTQEDVFLKCFWKDLTVAICFTDEKYLRFFRTYTQRNCELECASNFTAMTCGCVPLYMPQRHSLEKSSLTLEDAGNPTESHCGCLQACLELSYEAEVSQAVYNVTNYNELGNYANPTIANGWRVPSGLVLYFGSEQFTSLRRSELYGGVSFLANCGGILGLFMGFSFLSLAEILYYFTIRLWRQVLESRRAEREEK